MPVAQVSMLTSSEPSWVTRICSRPSSPSCKRDAEHRRRECRARQHPRAQLFSSLSSLSVQKQTFPSSVSASHSPLKSAPDKVSREGCRTAEPALNCLSHIVEKLTQIQLFQYLGVTPSNSEVLKHHPDLRSFSLYEPTDFFLLTGDPPHLPPTHDGLS